MLTETRHPLLHIDEPVTVNQGYSQVTISSKKKVEKDWFIQYQKI